MLFSAKLEAHFSAWPTVCEGSESLFDTTGICYPATRKCEMQGPRRNTFVGA